MAKRKITARDLLADLHAQMTDFELMGKYKLSAQGLQSVFNKLVKAGLITQAELDSRASVTDKTVDLGFVCPSCGYLRNEEFDQCPRCGFATPTYIKREREKERRRKDLPAPAKKSMPESKRNVAATTIALPPEPGELPLPVQETVAAVDDTPAAVRRNRRVVVAGIVVYAVALGILCVVLLFMPSNSMVTATQMLVAILLLQIPLLVIVLVSLKNLRLLTESFKPTE